MSAVTVLEPHYVSADEFFDLDQAVGQKLELHHGIVVNMAPLPAVAHGHIAGNIGAALKAGLKPPCVVFITPLVRVAAADTVFGPDVAVSCKPQRKGAKDLENPTVIVEVLSPSTASFDIRSKTPAYQAMASVTDILLVASGERRVTHWQRGESGWHAAECIGQGTVALRGLPVLLDLDAIYESVPL